MRCGPELRRLIWALVACLAWPAEAFDYAAHCAQFHQSVWIQEEGVRGWAVEVVADPRKVQAVDAHLDRLEREEEARRCGAQCATPLGTPDVGQATSANEAKALDDARLPVQRLLAKTPANRWAPLEKRGAQLVMSATLATSSAHRRLATTVTATSSAAEKASKTAVDKGHLDMADSTVAVTYAASSAVRDGPAALEARLRCFMDMLAAKAVDEALHRPGAPNHRQHDNVFGGRCKYDYQTWPVGTATEFAMSTCPGLCAMSTASQQSSGEIPPTVSGRLLTLDRDFVLDAVQPGHSGIYRCRNKGATGMRLDELCFADSEHSAGPMLAENISNVAPFFSLHPQVSGDCGWLYASGEFWQASCSHGHPLRCLCEWTLNCPPLTSGYFNTNSTLRYASIPEGRVYKTATAACDEGYELVGEPVMRCERGPVWSPPAFSCVRTLVPGPHLFRLLPGNFKAPSQAVAIATVIMDPILGRVSCSEECYRRDGALDGSVCFTADYEMSSGACRLFAQRFGESDLEAASGFRVIQLV